MADSIVRLKVDSSEYDNKIKRAAQGLQQLTESLNQAGKSLTDADKDQVDFIKELGNMETVAKGAKARINEMSQAFINLSVEYNKMSEQEKQSPPGQALAESLAKLRERTINAKEELANLNSQLEPVKTTTNETGGVMGTLKDKLTVNIDAMKLFSLGLQAAKAALDVAKDAFLASEANVDEWGRTVDSAKSLYEGFLTAINTGDISGFLGRIDEIVKAAREAYNELDRLGTMRTIQAPQMSAQQAENERIRSMIMTGKYIAPMDGRANTPGLVNGQQLTAEQIRALENQLKGGMDKIVGLVGNEVKQTGKAIDAVYNRQAKELGMSMKEFQKGTSSMAEFDKRMQGFAKYNEWNAQAQREYARQGGRGSVDFDKNNPYADYRKWGTFRVDGDRYNELVQLIQQRDQQMQSAYGMQAQAYRTINRAEGTTVRNILNGNTGGIGGGGGRNVTTAETLSEESIAYQEKLVQELTKKWREAGAAVRDDYAKQLGEAKQTLSEMQGGFTPSNIREITNTETPNLTQGAELTLPVKLEIQSPVEQWKDQIASLQEAMSTAWSTKAITAYQDEIDALQKKIDKFTGKTDGGNMAKDWQNAANAIGQVGSAMQQIEDPAAKVMGIIAQAIATIAMTFAKSMEGTFTPWDWIAGAAAGTATMISTISAIKSATAGSYAEGGVIPGTHYSGDTQWAQVNAGELILNRSQQGNLASQLEGGAADGGYAPSHISGEQIYVVLNRYTRRTGKGELVTWRN